MKLGEAQQFLHRNTVWLIRGLGAFVGLIIPPYRYLFPEDSIDPMWMRWTLSAVIFTVLGAGFVFPGMRRLALPATYLLCTLLMGWMLGLAFANGLEQSYASSYFIMLFTSLILIRDWRWLLPITLLNVVGVVVGASLVKDAVFNPVTFSIMAITILLIASAGIVTGWLEYWSVSQREQRLRSINRAAFGTATDAIVVTDINGDVLTFNGVFRDFWKPHEPKMGESSASTWVPLLQGMLADPNLIVKITQTAHREPTESITELLALRDGRFVKLRSQPVIEENETLGRIWFFRDVTKAQRSAEAMEQSHDRLRRQNAALVKLSMHEEMLGSDDEAALRLVTQEVVHSMDADRAAIWRLENGHQELVCEDIFFRSSDMHQKGAVVSAGQSPAYFQQLATERVIHIRNASKNALTEGFKLPYLTGEKERNVLDVPLRIAGQLYGVLSAEREGQEWTIEDQQFLASVGDLLAVFFESVERRKAEVQLANSIALLKAVFESTGVGILVTRPDRTLIDCNNTYLGIFKLDRDFAFNGEPDEVIAASRRQLVDATSVEASMRFLMSHPDQNHTENLVFKDGRIVERFTEVLQVGQEVVGRVWFYRDVTERVRAEAAILDSEQRNKAIIEAIPDLIARVDPAGKILDLKMPDAGPLSQLAPKGEGDHLQAFFPAEFVEEA
ncbi:MAG TPA: GAF domain-containing protein, partial [Bacteroidia bacterium]|nr:GAF domain-containing protein [Bacteroidia bacterium]